MSEVKANKISPATGTAFTLGDSGDTFTVPSGANIVNSGTATGFGGGGVLQVKSALLQSLFNSNSSSWLPITGLTVDITPSSASNKIMVIGHLCIVGQVTSNSLAQFVFGRDGSAIGNGSSCSGSGWNCAGQINQEGSSQTGRGGPYALSFLDAPASTSSLTYSIMCSASSYGGTRTFYVNANNAGTADSNFGGSSCITVMEIDSSVL